MPQYHSQRNSVGNSRFSRRAPSSRNRRPGKEYIDYRRFIRPATPTASVEVYVPLHQFSDFSLNPILSANIATKGLITPTPIQDQTIPQGLASKDIVGIADTGTGKTLAFMIPILNRLLADRNSRALVMAPTRELAQQIDAECRLIAKGSGIRGAVLIGGAGMGLQFRDLSSNPQLVIGTPGRIKDHVERGSLVLSRFNIAALDEVDRMLDMGFIADTQFLLSQLAPERQSFFFSATMGPKVQQLINTFSTDYETVSVKKGDTSENVEQNVIHSQGGSANKLEQLHELLNRPEVGKVLVFDETRHSVERLGKELLTRGFSVDAIHGGKSQHQRQRALDRFRHNDINILIATDVAARGIDIVDITHVINYSTPQSYEDYVHRVGRAGRAGRPGHAWTFVEQKGGGYNSY